MNRRVIWISTESTTETCVSGELFVHATVNRSRWYWFWWRMRFRAKDVWRKISQTVEVWK